VLDHLREDADGDLARSHGADVEAGRRLDPADPVG
jgi:hypothetical protein